MSEDAQGKQDASESEWIPASEATAWQAGKGITVLT